MRHVLVAVFLLFAASAMAEDMHDVSELHPELARLYNAIHRGESLVGSRHAMELELKFASADYLLFYDGYVRLPNATTRYYFLTFEKGMALPMEFGKERNIFKPGTKATVSFDVLSVQKGPLSGNMPHLTVRLISISLERQAE